MNPRTDKTARYEINHFTIREMTECGTAIRTIGDGAKSMEEVANRIVNYLYDSLIDGETGLRACSMVRLFKTHAYKDLDAELQEFAQNMLGNKLAYPRMKCMVLLATVGEEQEWRSRSTSRGHKAVPLQSEEALNQIPMFLPLIEQFGMQVDMLIKPDPKFLLDLEQSTYNVYYVPEALGNPYIPAQKGFIIPYGIRSILGFGGLLPSGDMFAVPMFFKVPVSREVADLFRPISLSVKIAILPFEKAVFPTEIESPAKMDAQRLKSKIAALEQLLDGYEKTTLEQTDKLYWEIAERKTGELKLENYRIHLEELVRERTDELMKANEQLQKSISELTSAEERLKKYADDCERSNRELENFAYVASHDLKSPILSVAVNLKLFERRNREKIDTESLELIEDASASAARMQNLITDLLTYARIGANNLKLTKERINLTETLKTVLATLHAECEQSGCIIIADELPEIMAAPTPMMQLFQNLLSNAIKFRGTEPPRIEIQAKRGNNEWLISINDNGIGIPFEHKERIFELFQRGPVGEGYKGTGIGLAICKKIVEQHGGRIWVESNPGKGSTFYFTIQSYDGVPLVYPEIGD